jgi:hypothetical protein
MSSGFAAKSTAVCAGAKNSKSLAARVSGYGAGSQPIPSANATWHTNGQVLMSDVAARDVQAATSPASRIARGGRKSWRFAGDGSGVAGRSRRGKGQVFRRPFRIGSRRSASFHRCDREKPRLAAVTSLRHGVAKGKAKVSGFCSGEPQRSGPQRKIPESLAAQTTGFG